MGNDKAMITHQYSRQLDNQRDQNQWQAEQNDIDRQFQQDLWMKQFQAEVEQQNAMFDKESERWQEQFDIQNKYNEPKAQVARLLAAGINPAALAGSMASGGGSSGANLSGSSGASSPSPSTPSGHSVSPMAGLSAGGFSTDAALFSSAAQLADAMQKVGSSVIGGVDTVKKMQPTVDNIFADTQKKQMESGLLDIEKSIKQMFGKDKAGAEIWELITRSSAHLAQGRYDDAQAAYSDALTKFTNQETYQKNEMFPVVLANLQKYGSMLDSQTSANRASANASNAAANMYNSQASLNGAIQATYDGLRDGQIRAQDLANGLAEIQKRLASREDLRDAATNQDKISAIISQCEREGFATKEAAAKARSAVTAADWAEVDHFVGAASQALNTMSGVGHVWNGAVSNMNQQVRNDIQRGFVDAYSKRSDTYNVYMNQKTQNAASSRGVGDIMEHVPKPENGSQRPMSRDEYERWKREHGQ